MKRSALLFSLLLYGCHKTPDNRDYAAAPHSPTQAPPPPADGSCLGMTTAWFNTGGSYGSNTPHIVMPYFDVGCGDSVRVFLATVTPDPSRPGQVIVSPPVEIFLGPAAPTALGYYLLSGNTITVYPLNINTLAWNWIVQATLR